MTALPAYGGDQASPAPRRSCCARFLTRPRPPIHFVPTGTAANALSLSLLAPGWGKIFCHQDAHIQTSETGAPEFFTGGAKLVSRWRTGGKITPATLAGR